MKEITLFGKALNTKNVSPIEVNELAISKGYVVHPDCCNERVMTFLSSIPNNYNTTFYESVAEVIKYDRFELLVDQILHYASTYGTEYAGQVFVPNENFGLIDEPTIDFSDCKLIEPISIEEITEKINQLLSSGIAMKQDTLFNIFDLISEFFIQIDPKDVKNIEAKMMLFNLLGILPDTPEEFVRLMIYKLTDSTLVIKNRELINSIKQQGDNQQIIGVCDDMEQFGLDKLSSVFFRYKPIFLALRSLSSDARKTTNKLRKLAKKHHKPFVSGYWETILSKDKLEATEFLKKSKDLSNFKLVRLIKAIDGKLTDTESKFFLIRNGKSFIKDTTDNVKNDKTLLWMKSMLEVTLINNIREKVNGKIVKLPDNIRLSIPTSEKTYVGNIPFGSYIIPSKSNSVFGINWFGKDGAQDLDLSYMSLSGQKYGWNDRYTSDTNDIVYSGDMTSARPEACEYMFCKEGLENGIISVNVYNGENNSKYRFFIGQTDNDFTVSSNTPDESIIDFSTSLKITGEACIGFYIDGRIYFADLNQGSSSVSCMTSNIQKLIQYFIDTKDCFLYWDDILPMAGATIVTEGKCDIDLSNGDVTEIISLLA